MPHKRIYKCLPDDATDSVRIDVTDEDGQTIVTSVFDDLNETVAYFQEIKNELKENEKLEVVEINDFHFECQGVETILH